MRLIRMNTGDGRWALGGHLGHFFPSCGYPHLFFEGDSYRGVENPATPIRMSTSGVGITYRRASSVAGSPPGRAARGIGAGGDVAWGRGVVLVSRNSQ